MQATKQVTTPLAAFGGRVFYDIALSDLLAVEVGGDVLAPITRTTLAVDGEGVWTTSPLSGSIRAALVAHFE